MNIFRIRLGWLKKAAAICGLLVPALGQAAVIGSGVYAPDCDDPSQQVTVEIFGDGSAKVLSGGQEFTNLLTSYSFFGDQTPSDFHTAVLFDGAMAPIGEGEGGKRWLEIWLGESGLSILPNGDASQRWDFCRTVPSLRVPSHVGLDCSISQGSVALMICADTELGNRNHRLTQTFNNALARTRGAARANLYEEQRAWIERRDGCWNSSDRHSCIEHETIDQIAKLSAAYDLIRGGRTSRYRCVSWDGEWVYATPYATDPKIMKLKRGNVTELALLHGTETGSKYIADSGVTFSSHARDEALIEWPSHKLHRCWRR